MAIKKTVTPKQLEANRHNALHSTGPKTASGKKVSARNAIRHGLLASEIFIDGGDGKENPAKFAALLQGLRDHFSPEGTLEEMLVERVAVCYWRLRRALRCETGETRKLLDSAISDAEWQEKSYLEAQVRSLSLPPAAVLDRILRYETTIERQLYRALDQLERLQRQRNGDHVPPPVRLSVEGVEGEQFHVLRNEATKSPVLCSETPGTAAAKPAAADASGTPA